MCCHLLTLVAEPTLNQPAAQASFSIDIDDDPGNGNGTWHQPHSSFDHAYKAHACSHQQQKHPQATAPQLMFDIDDCADDEAQPADDIAQLQDRKASNQYASTNAAAPATAAARARAHAQPGSAQLQSAPQLWASQLQSAAPPGSGFSTARSAGLQPTGSLPSMQQQQVAKRLASFKPPRRVMPAALAKAGATAAGTEAHGHDDAGGAKPTAVGHEAGKEAEGRAGRLAAWTAQPLKRLRKAGQATPAPPQPPAKLMGSPDDGEHAQLSSMHCDPITESCTHTTFIRLDPMCFSFASVDDGG